MTIPELLKELGIKFATAGESKHVTEGWVGVVCPWCDGGKGNYGLGCNLVHGSWSCWKCGPKRPAETLARLSGLSERVCAKLWVRAGLLTSGPMKGKPKQGKYDPPTPGPEWWSLAHTKFLVDRGFDPDEIKDRWRVWGMCQSTFPPWSIIIPVTVNGEPVSWTSRSIGRVKHYCNARPEQESMPLKSILYGADLARNAVAVAEGPLDAWAIGQGGCATLGVGYTKSQVRQIASFPLRIVVFDAEPMAQRRARKLVSELGMFDGSTLNVVLSSGKDPSRCDRSELEELRAMLK